MSHRLILIIPLKKTTRFNKFNNKTKLTLIAINQNNICIFQSIIKAIKQIVLLISIRKLILNHVHSFILQLDYSH